MAEVVERVDISGKHDALPVELTGINTLEKTDTNRLYAEYDDGKRKQLTDLAHVVISFAAKATGEEIELVASAGRAGRKESRQGTNTLEAKIQQIVEERIGGIIETYERQQAEMQSEITRLKGEVERLSKPLHVRVSEAFGESWIPRHEGIAVARKGNDGFMEDGWTTVSEPYERDDEWRIRIEKEGREEEVVLSELARVQETKATEDEVDVEAMEASMDRIAAIQAELASNPSPERTKELVDELATEQAKMRAVWDGEEIEEPEIEQTDLPVGWRRYQRRATLAERMEDLLRRRPIREHIETDVVVPAAGRYVKRVEDEWVEIPEPRERSLALLLGGVALGGVISVAAWGIHELLEQKYLGHSPTREARHNGAVFSWPFSFGKEPDLDDFCHTHAQHLSASHINLKGIRPYTIHAKTPDQFQHGVLKLLKAQGVHHHRVTAEKIKQLDNWMRGHQIASGMRNGATHLVQNLVPFPKQGHHFPNVNASADQGFRIGRSGSGREALRQWVRFAERIGIRFSH